MWAYGNRRLRMERLDMALGGRYAGVSPERLLVHQHSIRGIRQLTFSLNIEALHRIDGIRV